MKEYIVTDKKGNKTKIIADSFEEATEIYNTGLKDYDYGDRSYEDMGSGVKVYYSGESKKFKKLTMNGFDVGIDEVKKLIVSLNKAISMIEKMPK